MAVEPAGELKESSGHHHIIVDGSPIVTGEVVPADEKHIHFGNGQIETTLTLAPGTQTLTLQFADGLDRSYGTGMSSTITVQIEQRLKASLVGKFDNFETCCHMN